MVAITDLKTAQAFTRFGFGARTDDTQPADPVAWLINQLTGPDTGKVSGFPNTQACLQLVANRASATTTSQSDSAQAALDSLFASEVETFVINAVVSKQPFRERLVWFWTNHFALLTNFFRCEGVAGDLVREVIRPNMTGTFQQLLLAVYQHPSMIYSLDNYLSVGPDSSYVQRRKNNGNIILGLNENLGRECLELHTVGVDEGYTQDDVDAMAEIITGWNVQLTAPQKFFVDPNKVEPVVQTLLGIDYTPGQTGGIAALSMLANHPSTYMNLATQLVTHFCSDTPDPNDVNTVAQAFASSGGSLVAAHTAIVNLASAWVPATKFRTPTDHAIAVLRALNDDGSMVASYGDLMANLGQPIWGCAFPNGWSDLAADWCCPAGMLLRADWSGSIVNSAANFNAVSTAANTLGPLLSPTSETALLYPQVATQHDQMTLLFCSPEFQRR